MAKKQEKEVEKWVTINGARVPIFKDGSIGGPKELRDKLKNMDSFEKSQKGLYTNTSNAKEQVDMLKAELKKHPNDIHTNEIKARLKKAQDRYNKLKKGEDPDKDIFKTKKEWDEEDKKKASQKETKKSSTKDKKKETTKQIEKPKYYTESELKDEKFRKDALEEMNRYERNWSYYSAKEKKNISPNGVKELRARIKEIENYEKASKANTIKANDDLKEKQIARNKAEAGEINKSSGVRRLKDGTIDSHGMDVPKDIPNKIPKKDRESINDLYKNTGGTFNYAPAMERQIEEVAKSTDKRASEMSLRRKFENNLEAFKDTRDYEVTSL